MAVVEAAFVMPLILLVAFGIIEYGWMFHKSHQIGNVARVGARQASMLSSTTAGVEQAVDDMLAAANIDAAYITRTVTPLVEEIPSGDPVTVTIDVVYKDGLWLTRVPFVPVPDTLHASSTFKKEGF